MIGSLYTVTVLRLTVLETVMMLAIVAVVLAQMLLQSHHLLMATVNGLVSVGIDPWVK